MLINRPIKGKQTILINLKAVKYPDMYRLIKIPRHMKIVQHEGYMTFLNS